MQSTDSHPQILFLSHGGGPMPLLGDPGHGEMIDCLKHIASKLNRPSAILVVSAHWEEKIATVTSGANPPLIYDYYGFPEESYEITYPCPGETQLAEQVYECLEQSGIECQPDKQRGFDHGLFIPLKIMYPDADIPCVQLSLLNSLDPSDHIKLGKALQNLNYENLLVIGSGFSFHNLKAFFSSQSDDSDFMNTSFERWLVGTCTNEEVSEEVRENRLINWENAPDARFCHPREEHLIPLHVCYGIAGSACSEYFELSILNKKTSMYLWT